MLIYIAIYTLYSIFVNQFNLQKMLTINYIRENKEQVVELLKIKNFDAKELVSKIIELDAKRRENKALADNKAAEMNSLSKQIGMLFKEGKQEEVCMGAQLSSGSSLFSMGEKGKKMAAILLLKNSNTSFISFHSLVMLY